MQVHATVSAIQLTVSCHQQRNAYTVSTSCQRALKQQQSDDFLSSELPANTTHKSEQPQSHAEFCSAFKFLYWSLSFSAWTGLGLYHDSHNHDGHNHDGHKPWWPQPWWPQTMMATTMMATNYDGLSNENVKLTAYLVHGHTVFRKHVCCHHGLCHRCPLGQSS